LITGHAALGASLGTLSLVAVALLGVLRDEHRSGQKGSMLEHSSISQS